MPSSTIKRCAKAVGALALAIALSGCIVVPYGQHYGYYRPHPYGYY